MLEVTDKFNFWNIYPDYAYKQYAYEINLVQEFQ